MRTRLLVLVAVFLLYSGAYAHAFPTQDQDCSKCHTLTKDEASTLLGSIIPNLKVLDVKTMPVKSLWEVDFESNGQKSLVYVDFSKRYLFSGALVDIKGRKNLTQERLLDITRVNVSKIPLKDALVMGNKDAEHKIIVFDDPD